MGHAGLRSVICLLRMLGPRLSSDLGGWMACTVGKHLSATQIADRNLKRALPDLDEAERRKIITKVWDNLGRNVGELPHLAAFQRTLTGAGWEIEGEEHIDPLKVAGTPALFFSGHFGNWELILPIAHALGFPVASFYRAASDWRTNALIQGLRQDAIGQERKMFAKGSAGALRAVSHLSV